MGATLLKLIQAMPCAGCPCDELDMKSECGCCNVEYHSTAPDSDSDMEVEADTICGSLHYMKK